MANLIYSYSTPNSPPMSLTGLEPSTSRREDNTGYRCTRSPLRMTITAVTIVDDSGGSSLLVRTCRSRTENHRSSGVNLGSETKDVDLESFGAYISDGSDWSMVRGGNRDGTVVLVKLVCSSCLMRELKEFEGLSV
ncbi:unnamed protein product [Lactuca saligna]|uniref:Uncharacterized protein n=1 Tax=Lactuca saligna TaxID=75948 RepID=A0AA36EMP0_LACSI|nr:unnamed protein product [Lactuca saligna]